MGGQLTSATVRDRMVALATGTVLLASLSACGGDPISDAQAHRALDAQVSGLREALTGSGDLAQPWSSQSARVADPTCGDDGFRWRAVASFGDSGTDTANAAAQIVGRLRQAGWRTQASVGAADDGAVLVPASPGGKNPADVSVDLTVAAADGGTRTTATMRTACFSRS